MEFIKKLVMSRAALLAFVGACLVAARRFGVVLPEGTEDAVSKLIDTGIFFVSALLLGSHLENKDPNAKKADS